MAGGMLIAAIPAEQAATEAGFPKGGEMKRGTDSGFLPASFFLSIVVALFGLFACAPTLSEARVEYAVSNAIVACTACHVSPAGGGIRTLGGKQYGLHGHPAGAETLTDLYQIDLRSVALSQEKSKESREGLGLMELLGAADFLVVKADEGKSETRFNASYNFGTFASGLRDAYVRWQNPHGNWIPDFVLFGLFQVPFGLNSDEHRTYVRIQSRTTHNDFYMGALAAKAVWPSLHLDLAVTNGFQNSADEGSGRFSEGPTSGAFLNLRWVPQSLPLLLGASARYNTRHSGESDPSAYSAYGALSLARLTQNAVDATLLGEVVAARYWNDTGINPELRRVFLPTQGFPLTGEVRDSTSIGFLGQLNIALGPKWVLLYKFEHLDLSRDRDADTFTRHGIGFRHFPTGHILLQARYEFADTTVQGLSDRTLALQDSAWIMGQFWF